MIKDISALLYVTFSVILNIIPSNINEILLTGSLALGIILVLIRIYKGHLDVVINKKKIKELDKKGK